MCASTLKVCGKTRPALKLVRLESASAAFSRPPEDDLHKAASGIRKRFTRVTSLPA